MKRKTIKSLRYIVIGLTAAAVGLVVANAVKIDAEADDRIRQIDQYITSHDLRTDFASQPETVFLSYADWKEQQNDDFSNSAVDPDSSSSTLDCDPYESEPVELDKYSTELDSENDEYSDIYSMDVWTLGLQYGISELDTTRTLKLISYEGYGESPLSYYVACCCWVRATEGYWGYSNLYQAFGEADTSYDEWMDCIEIADWAYTALEQCYRNPSYVTSCNGMEVPAEYVYAEFDGSNMIYVW